MPFNLTSGPAVTSIPYKSTCPTAGPLGTTTAESIQSAGRERPDRTRPTRPSPTARISKRLRLKSREGHNVALDYPMTRFIYVRLAASIQGYTVYRYGFSLRHLCVCANWQLLLPFSSSMTILRRYRSYPPSSRGPSRMPRLNPARPHVWPLRSWRTGIMMPDLDGFGLLSQVLEADLALQSF